MCVPLGRDGAADQQLVPGHRGIAEAVDECHTAAGRARAARAFLVGEQRPGDDAPRPAAPQRQAPQRHVRLERLKSYCRKVRVINMCAAVKTTPGHAFKMDWGVIPLYDSTHTYTHQNTATYTTSSLIFDNTCNYNFKQIISTICKHLY